MATFLSHLVGYRLVLYYISIQKTVLSSSWLSTRTLGHKRNYAVETFKLKKKSVTTDLRHLFFTEQMINIRTTEQSHLIH